MDILEQYKQQYPEADRASKPAPMANAYGREYSGMTPWVIGISGGRIRNARQASMTLLITSAVIAAGALTILFWSSGTQTSLPKNFNQIDQSQYAAPR